MKFTSKTGLLASKIRKVYRFEKLDEVQFNVVATPAPYALKPYAGLYNPYPYGCSHLCNHPADDEVKELFRKARTGWENGEKHTILIDEIDNFNRMEIKVSDENFGNGSLYDETIGCLVPEEMFRKYTQTDSRPMTPVPTLASARTRASGSRRCVTPDPSCLDFQVREKTMLVVDLRRSHSQETISWHSSSLLFPKDEVPSITIQKVPGTDRRATSAINFLEVPAIVNASKQLKKERTSTSSPAKVVSKQDHSKQYLDVNSADSSDAGEDTSDDEGTFRRRGRKRRKRRGASRDPPAFQNSIDPETQIVTIGPDSHNPSARPSLVAGESVSKAVEEIDPIKESNKRRLASLSIDSFLDMDALKLLRRHLNEELIDQEFNEKRRKALEEAFKTVKPDTEEREDLLKLKEELNLSPPKDDLWLRVPRKVSRSSARFELPMDSRKFDGMTPMEYAKDLIYVNADRKQLYNIVFNRHKIDNENELTVSDVTDGRRVIFGTSILPALNDMMSEDLTEEQSKYFRGLVGWKDEDVLDFKTFCGLCAMCERLLAKLEDPKKDPCLELEKIDFRSLERRLHEQNIDERLREILFTVKKMQ